MAFSIAGKIAGPIGFGLLGLCRPPALASNDAIKVMKAAFDRGANLWSGAEFYGAFSRAGPDNSLSGISTSIDNCLRILDNKVSLDIFLPSRIDTNVPIEDTVRTLADYIKKGKISGYGLSECNAATLRRAHAIHPASVVEIELSLFSTEVLSNGVAHTCAELGIAIIAYSPLSRGFLTGQIKSLDDIPENDSRRMFPRFGPDVFDSNVHLVKEIEKAAERTGFTIPQVAIAWVASQSEKIGTPVIPIPGCTTVERVEENLARVSLEEKDLGELSEMVNKMVVLGDRYPEIFQKYVNL